MFSAPCNAASFAPPLVFPPGTHSPEIAPGSLPVATLYLNRLSPHPCIMYPRRGATLSFIAILQVALK